MGDRIQRSMDFLTNCVCRSNDFEYKYSPISMRFIEKSPDFIEKLLNNFLTKTEKEFISKRFGLEDGKRVTYSYLFHEFNIKNKSMMRRVENEIFRKIKSRISKYLDMCQLEKIEDPFVDMILGEIGIERFINLFSKINGFDKVFFDFNKDKINNILDMEIDDMQISKKSYDELSLIGVIKIIQLLNIFENENLDCISELSESSKLEIQNRLSIIFPNYSDFFCIGKKIDVNEEINQNRCFMFFDEIDISIFVFGPKIETIFRKHNINTIADLLYLYVDLRFFESNTEYNFENLKFKGMEDTDVLFVQEKISDLINLIFKLKSNDDFFLFSVLSEIGLSKLIYLSTQEKKSYEPIFFKYRELKQNINLQKLDEVSIDFLELSVIAKNGLKRNGIFNILQLVKIIEFSNLRGFKNVGIKLEREVMLKLSEKFPNYKDFDTSDVDIGSYASKKIEIYDFVLDYLDIKVLGFDKRINIFLKRNKVVSVADLIVSYNEGFKEIKKLKDNQKRNELKLVLMKFIGI